MFVARNSLIGLLRCYIWKPYGSVIRVSVLPVSAVLTVSRRPATFTMFSRVQILLAGCLASGEYSHIQKRAIVSTGPVILFLYFELNNQSQSYNDCGILSINNVSIRTQIIKVYDLILY